MDDLVGIKQKMKGLVGNEGLTERYGWKKKKFCIAKQMGRNRTKLEN